MRNKPKRLENSSNDLNEDSGVPSVWREICERQLHRRLKAERENSQLKQELAREEELAKSIQKLLYKRRIPKETGPEAQKHTRRTDIPAGYIERMAAFIFDELAAGVDIMYRQMEGVYEAITSLPTVERPFLHGSVKGKDAKLLDRKVLDFNLHAVGDAWWQTWHNHRQRNVHESQDDTIVETFGLEMNDFNANISVSSFGQQILRRSVEEQRIMFIWNAYMEPFVFENERVSGIYFLEQCHVYIKPEEVDEGKFSTSMSTFYTITPYVLAPESPKDMKAVDFFVSSLFSTIKTRSEMVENLLLDQVLEKYNFSENAFMNESERFELDGALAFSSDMQLVDTVAADATGLILPFDNDGWNPQLLLEALEECHDLEHSTTDQAEPRPILASESVIHQENKALATTKSRKKNFNPNKAREERRFQLGQLRKEVEDLELTLKQWQDIRRRQSISANLDKTDRSTIIEDKSNGVPAVWEEICANQLRHRLKAERENIRLKEKYNEELQLVKRIEKLLFKRLKLSDTPPSETSKHMRRTNLPPGYIKHIATVLFEELAAGIDICYRLRGDFLGVNTFIPTEVASRMPLLRGGLKGTEKTLFDRRILPFSTQETSDAWWTNWHSYRGHNREIANNIIMESFGLEMNDIKTNTSVTSYGQQILRRDVEDGLTVFVWNAYLEPFVFDDEQVSGIYFLEQCHMIVKPEEDRTATDENERSSCMSGCYVTTPYFLDATLQNDPKTAALIEFLVGALFSNMKAHNDAVEDLLLDQALQKHSNR
ncbi:ATP-binding cassette (ABC) Superfamily [Phytophthora palmivora]|uniref:ATP-binding cassette (ABC) Superfamily n=1 Tax=Phytophthora palmivora TaxID=4796 RepID=A0A2P4XY47_9STRA|nr:ATP-binding cassette (ABC) Superfamily [Phytophthora palmivora]